MNDEELGQFLRSEVPAPKAEYWSNIDAILTEANDGQKEESEPDWETEPEIIRLTDMDRNLIPIRHRTRTLWLSMAAAIFVIIGGFAVALITENNNNTATAANSDDQSGDGQTDGEAIINSETTEPTTPTEAAEQAGDDDSDDADSGAGDGAEGPDTDPASETTVATDDDAVYWDFTYGSTINMRSEPSFTGPVIGRWAGDEQGILGTGRTEVVDGYEWAELTYQWALDGDRQTGWVGREFIDVSTAPPDINDPVFTEGEPRLWNFAAAGSVFSRSWPGFGGLIESSWAGDEQGIEGTGRTAMANGFQWIELASGEERGESWVARDFLELADLDWLIDCYSSGGDAMVLDFSDDAMTFVGALRITTDFGIDYYGVAGARTVGTAFDVAVQPNGEKDVDLQEWLATAEGMSAGNLTFVDAVSCNQMPQAISELEEAVLTYPELP